MKRDVIDLRARILCVCVENSARSPMMAAFLQRELGINFRVTSAGTAPEAEGKPADEDVVFCMKKRGFDLSGHAGRWINRLSLRSFTHVICVNKTVTKAVLHLIVDQGTFSVHILVPRHGIPLRQNASLAGFEACASLLEKEAVRMAEIIRRG